MTGVPRGVVYVVASMVTGGTQTHLLQLFNSIDRRRFRPHLYVLREGGNLIASARALDVPTTTFGIRGTVRSPRDMAGMLRMIAALRALRPAIVHGYLLRGNFAGAVAARAAGVPIVVTSKRGCHLPASRAERFSVRVSNRLSDTVTGNSPKVLEFTREVEPPFAAPMEMIPSGIDVDRFDPARVPSDARGRLRAEHGLGEAPLVATAITWRPIKGFRMLFETLARLRLRVPDLRLALAGEAEWGGEPLALAQELDLLDCVVLLGRRDDMPQVLAAADVFVLPSQSEGMSNAILEAMAMELPVVVTAVGGAPIMIDQGRSGYLVDYGDPDAMASRLAELLGDPDKARALGREARRKVVSDFSATGMTRRTESLYDRLLAGRRRG